MQCPKCGAQNRDESNFCRYCATPLAAADQSRESGYIPSVPPPGADSFANSYPPPGYQPQPQPPAQVLPGQLICPRCGSNKVIKGGTPQWAILVAVIGFFVVCFLSLFFLMVKDKNQCLHCGLHFN
jgi:RNA polymerase subunit RPABC4/transcription elongation factor Spt4